MRRWISQYNREGMAGLADRPRLGRPRLGRQRLTGRIAMLLARPGRGALPRIRRYLGWPQVSLQTLYRRVRLVAIWRRPQPTARGDPGHDHVVAQIVARLTSVPCRSVVLAKDETHLNLLPHARTCSTLRYMRPQVLASGRTRRSPCWGARGEHRGVGVPAGPPGRGGLHRAAESGSAGVSPRPVIVVICDNDSIRHARTVAACLEEHPRLELLYGARYSPHDNPTERIWEH